MNALVSVDSASMAELAAHSNRLPELAQLEATERNWRARHSRDLYHDWESFLSCAPVATIECNADRQVREWNTAAEQLFGHARTTVLGLDCLALLVPEAKVHEGICLWQRILATGKGTNGISKLLTKDKQTIYCLWSVSPRITHGRVSSIITQFWDVTAWRDTLNTENEFRQHLEDAQQLAHVGYWHWDYTHSRAVFSKEVCRIFDKPLDWIPNLENILELIPADERCKHLSNILDAYARRLPEIDFEHRVVTSYGNRYVHTRARIKYRPDGSVAKFLATTQDITDVKTYAQRLHAMAYYDSLTALPNRVLFNELAQQAIAQASMQQASVGVMILDLDRFKHINDSLGHSAGDQLLREVATRLSHSVRSTDTVARLGGDEFAILLPGITDETGAAMIVSRIIDGFKAPFLLAGRELFISTSIGIALYPRDSREVEHLVQNADAAMYHSKTLSRGNFQFYSKHLTTLLVERLALETALRRAQQNDEFEVYYQPQVNLASGEIVGAEALLRWHHSELGLLTPDKFIGVAEELGLIVDIGAWVLHCACQAAVEWNKAHQRPLKIAVNLSSRQFKVHDLVATVRTVLEETHCSAEWLELEITESLLLEDDEETRRVLEQLSQMGITIAIDDFGTGFSALSYLKLFPIDGIKIDRSFMRDIAVDPDSAALVVALIGMAHSLRLDVIAEGIETEEQESWLKAHGCMLVQGFRYARPLTRAQFETLRLTNRNNNDAECNG